GRGWTGAPRAPVAGRDAAGARAWLLTSAHSAAAGARRKQRRRRLRNALKALAARRTLRRQPKDLSHGAECPGDQPAAAVGQPRALGRDRPVSRYRPAAPRVVAGR